MFGKFLKEPRLWMFHNIYNTAYTGEITDDQRAGMAKAGNKDFAANNYTYYYTEPVGPDTANPTLVAQGAKLWIIRSKVVNPDNLVEEARIFAERVRSGNAFKNNTPGSTTTTTSGAMRTAEKSSDTKAEPQKSKGL